MVEIPWLLLPKGMHRQTIAASSISIGKSRIKVVNTQTGKR